MEAGEPELLLFSSGVRPRWPACLLLRALRGLGERTRVSAGGSALLGRFRLMWPFSGVFSATLRGCISVWSGGRG